MPSKKQYNLVSDDAYDSRIPLYNEEAFQHGITFHAKYIGSLDVPRPSSRVEIVAAMRRIRYEFKAKSIKKRKVSLTVSVDGVKVVPRSKRRNNRWPWEENKFIILHHPIYRIFYVSHDSQDLKIFSYIARDGGTNAFKCNVFKSKKKSQAMRIVRTVGQAFEVCHKLSLALATSNTCEEAHSLSGNEEVDALPDQSNKGKSQGDGASEPNSCDTQDEISAVNPVNSSTNQHSLHPIEESTCQKTEFELSKAGTLPESNMKVHDSNVYHQIHLLKEEFQKQSQQLQVVIAQVQYLKDQLTAEKTARIEAQEQNHLLLLYNKELLEHIQKLVSHIYEMEGKCYGKDRSSDTLSESFHLSPPTAPDSKLYLEKLKYLSVKDKNGIPQESPISNFRSVSDTQKASATTGHLEDHFPSDPVTSFPSNFSRQSSVLASFHGSSNSPKPGSSSVEKADELTKAEWLERIGNLHMQRADMNRLIMNYLVTEGFKGAAEKFRIESGIQPSVDLDTLDERIKIRDAIQNGKIQEAIQLVNNLHPELLDCDRYLFFHLQQQHLIELIRQRKIEEALKYAQEQLAERGEENKEVLSELERTLALLAFDKPEQSPFGDLLHPSHRQKIASEVNASILEMENRESTTPKLAIMLKLMLWSQEELEKKKVKYPKMTDIAHGIIEDPK